ncbi:aldehyde dehydrogenase family protein [Pseudomonas sp. BN414]|uniref:aldehyde dehydrogenase family protein n=1 Tax=Pseudomonas sp. BN414 TaxID=2567888 RepID=UPI0024572987|nr:aldehyde dehydrogenase family protein [Pseudomonas sp. BN414]MDH4565459.1 aldehyde dehydrogenase family protein [Pseudomonas sp. BN414]
MSEIYNPILTIGGESVSTARALEVINPATGEVVGRVPDAGLKELEQAVQAAQQAFLVWRAASLDERKVALNTFAKVLEDNVDELSRLLTLEQGRPLTLARDEILGAAFWIRGITLLELPVEVQLETPLNRVEVHQEPLGVVCGIVPWNYPVMLGAWKIAHALFTGNTLVLKPSPFTPLTTLRIGELTREILPPGVLNIISGGDALGPMMTGHKAFAKIAFTGSTATGKRIMASAAQDLKRLTLELGGNDAAIVLADVNVDDVAQALFDGAFTNSGQICVACKRLYIHDSIYDVLRDKLHSLVKAAKVGNGLNPDVRFGPVQNLSQYRRVRQLRDEARESGLILLEGSPVPDSGYFLPLTLVDNPPDTAPVVTEEAFGPILPLLRFHEVDEVIERVNQSDFGLAAAVWSSDIEQAKAIAMRLEVGTVWINQNLVLQPDVPMAGYKQSGFGVENSVSGLLAFTQPKAVFVPKVG